MLGLVTAKGQIPALQKITKLYPETEPGLTGCSGCGIREGNKFSPALMTI